MPRVKPLTENERRNERLQFQLAGLMKTKKISGAGLAKKLGISTQTFYRHRDHPENMTLREIRILREIFPKITIE